MSVLRFYKTADWKTHWTYGFLKDLNRFFFQKPRKSKNGLYYKEKQTRKLFSDFKVGVLFRAILNLARPSR